MAQAAQKRSGGNDHAAGEPFRAVPAPHADHAASLDQQLLDKRFHHGKARRRREQRLQRLRVERLVHLGAQGAHGRSFARVQHPQVGERRIRDQRHRPAQRIHLAHQMALGGSADRAVAGQPADAFPAAGHQQRLAAHPRRGERGFAPGVPAADHQNIVTVPNRIVA
jgi:hypothetical protein